MLTRRRPTHHAGTEAERDEAVDCGANEGCGWTVTYACPGSAQPGSSGRFATDDGTLSFYCCCGGGMAQLVAARRRSNLARRDDEMSRETSSLEQRRSGGGGDGLETLQREFERGPPSFTPSEQEAKAEAWAELTTGGEAGEFARKDRSLSQVLCADECLDDDRPPLAPTSGEQQQLDVAPMMPGPNGTALVATSEHGGEDHRALHRALHAPSPAVAAAVAFATRAAAAKAMAKAWDAKCGRPACVGCWACSNEAAKARHEARGAAGPSQQTIAAAIAAAKAGG